MSETKEKTPAKITQTKRLPKPVVDKIKAKVAPAPPVLSIEKVTGCPENFRILHHIEKDGVIVESLTAVQLPSAVLVKLITPTGCSLTVVPHVQIIEDSNGGAYLQH